MKEKRAGARDREQARGTHEDRVDGSELQLLLWHVLTLRRKLANAPSSLREAPFVLGAPAPHPLLRPERARQSVSEQQPHPGRHITSLILTSSSA